MTSPCQLPGCSGMSQPSSWHTTHIRTRLHFSPHFSNHKTHLCLCISLVITKPNENVLLKRPVAPGANSPLKDSGPNSQAPAVLQPCDTVGQTLLISETSWPWILTSHSWDLSWRLQIMWFRLTLWAREWENIRENTGYLGSIELKTQIYKMPRSRLF